MSSLAALKTAKDKNKVNENKTFSPSYMNSANTSKQTLPWLSSSPLSVKSSPYQNRRRSFFFRYNGSAKFAKTSSSEDLKRKIRLRGVVFLPKYHSIKKSIRNVNLNSNTVPNSSLVVTKSKLALWRSNRTLNLHADRQIGGLTERRIMSRH